MKKRYVWIIAIVILTLLITRSFLNHVDGVEKERQWYIRELDFRFSAVVDTVMPPAKVLLHVTEGNLDRNKEKRIGEKLRYNGRLDLFLYQPPNRVELMVRGAEHLRRGDSVYLNSATNIVRIYRHQDLIVESELINSLRGRPF